MAIELGLTGTAEMIVGDDDTAIAHGTGDAAVLSTPRLLQLMQQATMDALKDQLPEGVITAGLRINLDHLRSSYVGASVSASAMLTRLEGRRLVFEAEATSGDSVVGVGRIIRVQIDRERFLRQAD
ncbi:MAG: hotdog domain-containing protein [Acidimicrobiia bacterium]|nr:hotdog domain-containing protein [Acidimicrobiia bacterium]